MLHSSQEGKHHNCHPIRTYHKAGTAILLCLEGPLFVPGGKWTSHSNFTWIFLPTLCRYNSGSTSSSVVVLGEIGEASQVKYISACLRGKHPLIHSLIHFIRTFTLISLVLVGLQKVDLEIHGFGGDPFFQVELETATNGTVSLFLEEPYSKSKSEKRSKEHHCTFQSHKHMLEIQFQAVSKEK